MYAISIVLTSLVLIFYKFSAIILFGYLSILFIFLLILLNYIEVIFLVFRMLNKEKVDQETL